MTKHTIAVTRLIPKVGIELLKEHFTVVQHKSSAPPDRKTLLDLLENVDGVVSLLSDKIDAELLDNFPDLKVIANMAVGYENVDVEAAANRGIWVTNTPDVLTDATADLAMSLILAVTRRIVESDKFMRSGNYHYWDPRLLRGMQLSGKNLGVFGFGRIGQATAKRAQAFGMKILFHDPNADTANLSFEAAGVSFDQLVEKSDVLTVHSPYLPELHHLFDKTVFEKMKTSAYFINTARGGLMNENDLHQALKSGQIAGAGLDVYENEPSFVPELAHLDNVVMLPHIGSATIETRDAMAELAAQNVIEILQGGEPITPVNKPKEK